MVLLHSEQADKVRWRVAGTSSCFVFTERHKENQRQTRPRPSSTFLIAVQAYTLCNGGRRIVPVSPVCLQARGGRLILSPQFPAAP